MVTPSRKKTKAKYLVKVKQFPIFPQFGGSYGGGKNSPRKKTNFMVQNDLLDAMKFYIPSGERSDFVNGALEEALQDIARKKAMDAMDEMRKRIKWKMTDKEFRKAREYGRE